MDQSPPPPDTTHDLLHRDHYVDAGGGGGGGSVGVAEGTGTVSTHTLRIQQNNDIHRVQLSPNKIKLVRNFIPHDIDKPQNGPTSICSSPDPANRVLDVRKDTTTTPKITIKPLVQPPIEKMTIKISRRGDDLDCDGEDFPKTTYKVEHQSDKPSENERDSDNCCPQVPKLTIKVPPELCLSPDNRQHSPSVPKLIIRAATGGKAEDVSRFEVSSAKTNSHVENAVDSEHPTVPKLTIRPLPVPESLRKPLEVITSLTKYPESGQHSPRIILKINKTDHGSTSEIVTDETPVPEPQVPKLTIKIHPENDEIGQVSPLGKIKLKLTKEGDCATIVGDESENRPVDGIRTKRPVSEDDDSLLDDVNSHSDVKKMKLDQIFNNSLLSVEKMTNAKRHPDDDAFEELAVSSTDYDGRVKCIPPNGSSKLRDVLASLQKRRPEDVASDPIDESRPEVDAESNSSSEVSSGDLDGENSNRPDSESPEFNKVDHVVSNDRSDSRECLLVDELSQDPLDIESAVKGHFVLNANSKTVESNLLKLTEEVPLRLPPRRRGRPRKYALPEEEMKKPAPVVVIKAVEERPIRKSKIIREKPLILQTTRRGRGRGAKKDSLLGSPRVSSDLESPAEISNSFFLNMADKKSNPLENCEPKTPETVHETEPSDNDIKSPADDSDGDFEAVNASPRGKGRPTRTSRAGRMSTMHTRAKAIPPPPPPPVVITPMVAKTPKKTGRPPKRKTLMAFEEVQLQEATPVSVSKKKGKKSKVIRPATPTLDVFEEETCMIGDNMTPMRNVSLLDEESQSSLHSAFTSESSKGKKSKTKDRDKDASNDGPTCKASDVAEWDWPTENSFSDCPQTHMIQEQVALFLGIKNFKRNYPDLKRRTLSPEEKNYLIERGLITETLSVTAVDAGEIIHIMYSDFPKKYDEYRKYIKERKEPKPKPPPQITTEKSKQETLEKAVESAALWNAQFNKQRNNERSASFDLQSLTLHRPRKSQAVQPRPNNMSCYPVALLTGQYTDYFKYYTPDELKYYPLNTMLELPPSPPPIEEDILADEILADSDKESVDGRGSLSDAASELIQVKRKGGRPRKTPLPKTELAYPSRPVSPNQLDESSRLSAPQEVPRCKLCSKSEHANRKCPQECFVICSSCHSKLHPSCLDMNQKVATKARTYSWQCPECKCCAECEDREDDDKMLFCDLCDRGYHIYCVGLKKVPNGRWHCKHCAVCKSCDGKSPAGVIGNPGVLNNPPVPEQWHHHFKKNNTGARVYSFTLCSPCARTWQAGHYCPTCEKCFTGKKGAMKLVICVTCDRAFHQECGKQIGKSLDILRFKCSRCRRGNPPPKKPRGGFVRHFGGSNRRPSQHGPRNDCSDSNQSNSMMDQNESSSDSDHENGKLGDSTFNHDESKSELFNEEDSVDSIASRPVRKKINVENLDDASRQSTDIDLKKKPKRNNRRSKFSEKLADIEEDLSNSDDKIPLRSESTLSNSKKTNISQLPDNNVSDEPRLKKLLESKKCVRNENSDKKPSSVLVDPDETLDEDSEQFPVSDTRQTAVESAN